MAEIHAPNKRCHNCRRQRLRCDRSYPHCNKCLLAGKECLGYGQLFRWTGAIASRGKLAGKTSSADVSALPSPSRGASPKKDHQPHHHEDRVRDSSPRVLESTTTDDNSRTEDWQLISRNPEPADAEISSPWVLTDPLMQDLSHPYRYYMSYCM
jgi:hypothetical protein